MTDQGSLHPDTVAVRGGLHRSNFSETAEAMFVTSGFVYDRAEDAAAAFAGESDRYIYSRRGNPTVAAFEDRLCLLEGAQACLATASGMSAVFTALGALLGAGDRVVASRNLFGANVAVLDQVLPRWGVETVFVDGADLEQWRTALAQPARAVFFETPSNPMQELVDIEAVCELAHGAGATVVVDNVFGTPVFSSPMTHGVDVVVYSATKHLDGQGRVLGGAVLGPAAYIEDDVRPLARRTGPTMSPFNAWVLVKGLETMRLRVEQQGRSALALAEALEQDPRIEGVRYPLLASHPQHDLAERQMTGGGTVVTFAVAGGREAAFTFMNALRLVDISNNLGDAKSMVTHPATTTHHSMDEAQRAAVGITDGTIRFSVGLEDAGDLLADIRQALDRVGS